MAEKSLFQLSKPPHILNPHNPKEMKMISTLWRARGLLGKFKTDEKLFKAVKNAMNNKDLSLGKALDLVFGKGNYKGLPLDYSKTGSSRTGDRIINEVFFNPRKVQQVIPLNVRDWVAQREKDGTFERAGVQPGILERLETRNKKGLTRLQKETRRLSRLYGIPFEMGHLTAIANLGTDNPANLFPELKSENRSHGAREDPLDSQTQQELGWGGGHWQDLMELIQEEGGNPAVFGVRSDQYTTGDQGNVARMGADPNMIGFKRRDQILLQTIARIERELEAAQKSGGTSDWLANINQRITDKGYQSLAPTLKPQPKGEIVSIGQTRPIHEQSLLETTYTDANRPHGHRDVISPTESYVWNARSKRWETPVNEGSGFHPVNEFLDTASSISYWGLKQFGGAYGQAVESAEGLYEITQGLLNRNPGKAIGGLTKLSHTSTSQIGPLLPKSE